ncbi:GCC2 and GCC3 domain-containing protein [Besnoitia besnoiti]|uniref:GCC2 and GCC3 domain-containing protein n=1 Tax=Besnoitia besnoiti TaxID=94643 RepID=A0A2A9LZA9_BESBE|nr:GCC2 and GCC3 domain-containing protein [Besnoitia besnoiti]PFH31738.1 GCC2 and GCC3 domain-containing protein [Besnoitia besnoiti]
MHAESPDSCQKCEPGLLCPEGSDRQITACPLGFYCEGGNAPMTPCPEGTYGKSTGTSTKEDACAACPNGSYCPGADQPYEPCPAGKFCTSDSPKPAACPAGTYCPGATSIPLECPLGFYCPRGTEMPVECPGGSLCPQGAAQPRACPAGTRSRGAQACAAIPTVEGCCEACPAGTFAAVEGSTACTACAAGYLCTAGSTSATPSDPREGRACPRGHYCPAGSLAPVPCPRGRYNAEEGAADEARDCLPCPEGTFSDQLGATSCSTCGGTSTSLAGEETCTCVGAGRTFLKREGTCVCRSVHEFYSATHLAAADGDLDSALDCQPIAQPRCANAATMKNPRFSEDYGSQLLRSERGACVLHDRVCKEHCGKDADGRFLASAGMCECFSPQDAGQQACGPQCRSETAELFIQGDELVYRAAGKDGEQRHSTQSLLDSKAVKGFFACPHEAETPHRLPTPGCRASFYLLNASGIFGTVGVPAGFQDLLAASQGASRASSEGRAIASSRAPEARAPLAASAAAAVEELFGRDQRNRMALLRRPTQCLHSGDTIVWMLAGAFPVYQRNSLLNTVPDFDTSPFKNVEDELAFEAEKADAGGITYFAFPFTAPGQYPRPTASISLGALSLHLRDDVLVEPELASVVLLFWGLVAVLVVFVLLVSLLRKRLFLRQQRAGLGPEASPHAFGVDAAAQQAQDAIEALLSHVIDSGREVDPRARVTRLTADELEPHLAAVEALEPKGDARAAAADDALDPSRFEGMYDQLARAHSTLAKAFCDRREATAALGRHSLDALDGLEAFVRPLIRRVDWRIEERSALQKSIAAVTRACEKLVGELRTPEAFLVADPSLAGASESGFERFSLAATGVASLAALEKLAPAEAFLFVLAEEVVGVLCMTRGESPSLCVVAEYVERLLQASPPDARDDAAPAAVLAGRSADLAGGAARLTELLEAVLQQRERAEDLASQLGQKTRADALTRARASEAIDRELVRVLLAAVEMLATGERAEEPREKPPSATPRSSRGEDAAHDPLQALQNRIQATCDRHAEELSRALEAQQKAYLAVLEKLETSRAQHVSQRHEMERVLLTQFLEFFRASKAERISRFYERLEASTVAKLREALKEELYRLERMRRREAWTAAEHDERRKQTLHKLEAQIKAATETLKTGKDALLLDTMSRLDAYLDTRRTSLESLHATELAAAEESAEKAREVVQKIFEQQTETCQADLQARQARFLLVAQNVARLCSRLQSGEIVPTAHLADFLADAASALSDLSRGQANARRATLEMQREAREEILLRRQAALSAKIDALRASTRRYAAQEAEASAALFMHEEDAFLPFGVRAIQETVDAVFASQIRQRGKAYVAVLRASEPRTAAGDAEPDEDAEAQQHLALKEEEKAKQIQAIEARRGETRRKREEALRAVAELEVEITERYARKLVENSERFLEDEAVEDSATIAAEAQRLSRLQTRLLSFLKRTLVAQRKAGSSRPRPAHGGLGDWAREAETLLQAADQDRRDALGAFEKRLACRSRAAHRASARSACLGSALAADRSLNELLFQIREKRQAVRASLFFLEELVAAACDAKFTTKEGCQIDGQYDKAARELEEAFERAVSQLDEEFELDAQAIEKDLAEARARIKRTEEMEKSRLDVELRLREATATSEEERAALRSEFSARLQSLQRDFEGERDAQERVFREKLMARRELLQKRKQQLAEKAQADDARTQAEMLRKKTLADKQRSAALFEYLLGEARAQVSPHAIKQLHRNMTSQLAETMQAMVLEQLAEKSARLTAVSSNLQAAYRQERAAAELDLDSKVSEAEKNLAAAPAAAQESLREEVEARKKMRDEKLRELDAKFSLKLESALQVERLAIEPLQAERVFDLKQESMKKIIKVLAEFVALGDPTALALTNEAQQTLSRIDADRARMKEVAGMQVLDVDRMLREKEAELKKQMEANVAALKAKLEAQREREEALQRAAREEEMKRRQERKKARQLEQLRRMANRGRADDPEATEDLFKKYEDDADKLEAALTKERARQLMLLQSRLHQKMIKKEKLFKQQGEGEISEEWERLKRTRELAAVRAEDAQAAEEANDEEEMWKYFFSTRVAEEVAKKARTIQELLRAALQQLTSGQPQGDGGNPDGGAEAFATPESIEKLLDHLSRLTEALVVPEDDEEEN